MYILYLSYYGSVHMYAYQLPYQLQYVPQLVYHPCRHHKLKYGNFKPPGRKEPEKVGSEFKERRMAELRDMYKTAISIPRTYAHMLVHVCAHMLVRTYAHILAYTYICVPMCHHFQCNMDSRFLHFGKSLTVTN